MRKRMFLIPIIILSIISIGVIGCNSDDEDCDNENENNAVTGTLEFYANGEDFVREGFVSKDGWNVSFDHLYVCLNNVTAYQTSPIYDPQTVGELYTDTIKAEADLGGPYTIDLAAGDENADPILAGKVNNAEIGSYNAISWNMIKDSSGPAEGNALVLIGTAEKDDDSVDFTIGIEIEYSYYGGEYVGDADKGTLVEDGTADVEMTFHFDHLFGDFEAPADDHVNLGAIGFDPFAALAVDDVVDEDMASLHDNLSAEDYLLMLETLPSLGHVGEGHCHCEQWW